jgi:hypothetical protein
MILALQKKIVSIMYGWCKTQNFMEKSVQEITDFTYSVQMSIFINEFRCKSSNKLIFTQY